MNPEQLKKLKQSFFKEGSLVYGDSGHKLIRSGKNYRCVKDSNQKCDFGEKQILKDTLDRAFSRKASKMYCEKFPAEKTIKRLLRDSFWDVAFGIDDRTFGSEEVQDSTLILMQQDVEEKGEVDNELIEDFKESSVSEREAGYPMMLFAYAIGMVKAVSMQMSEAERGRTLALFSKQVNLNTEGKIESIELERWAWYLLNTIIERNMPGYIKSLKSLNIINGPDELHKKGLVEASLAYGEDGFEDALGENFAISLAWISMIKDSFDLVLINDPQKATDGLPLLFEKIRNDIPLNAMLSAISVIK
jgi:hypothetical protein